MSKLSIAIIDTIGLAYDGNTLKTRGLGGSESAVILMSKELARAGFDVTVFNDCQDDLASPGTYDGVKFKPVDEVVNDYEFDIVVSSRTVVPFVPDYMYEAFRHIMGFRHDPAKFEKIRTNAKYKILWMHDTFCQGDMNIEELVTGGYIDELFTLSDFHTAYVTNCDHGRRRNFEVLKNKVFMTRNGIVRYFDEVDVDAKDPNLFVYNASLTKGMEPLVHNIWPKIKQVIPEAKLKVIGGFYRFRSGAEPDAQEKQWRKLIEMPIMKQLDVEFTGVITQREIAEIMRDASFFLFPALFPETFGISTLESLAYNTPLVTCRFGALEETAIDQASYFIDYAIDKNGLFPLINHEEQVNKYVDTVLKAYYNSYLHQQKKQYCSIVHEVCGWDTIALQWKQHIYKKMNRYLSAKEYRRVSYINDRVHRIFGRRFSNHVEWNSYKTYPQRSIAVITTLYNAEPYIEKCIESVASQDYDNYTMYIVDDASTDGSKRQIISKLSTLPDSIRDRFVHITQPFNNGAPFNQITTLREKVLDPEAIVMIIDGDDSLVNDNNIFQFYNTLYSDGTEFSYGSCWSEVDDIPLISQEYPKSVKDARDYRNYHLNWIMPYTHLRTFKRGLLDRVDDSHFKDETGAWYKAGGDGSVFYTMLEQANPSKVKVVKDIVYNYNDKNPLNDYKVNGTEQNINASKIVKSSKTLTAQPESNLNMEKKKVKKILIGIPTAKNIGVETFKSIYDLEIPEGYEVDFQYFFGYNIDQVRNLIAKWIVDGYDYLFSVDYDVSFPKDTLKRLLAHDVDLVSGLYIQRKHDQHTLEIYGWDDRGGVSNVPYEKIAGKGLVPIAGCGFGCVLIKKRVFEGIGYPWFVYHSALSHMDTVSEDVDFCTKAHAKGFKMFADTTLMVDHHGSNIYRVGEISSNPKAPFMDPVKARVIQLANMDLMPAEHKQYLKNMDYKPKVVYDIGASTLHWTRAAKDAWPNCDMVLFDAFMPAEFLYKDNGYKYSMGVLTDEDNKTLDFFVNDEHPAGNSYYRENDAVNPTAVPYEKKQMIGMTLDTVVARNKFPKPDLIKMDVQGAETDILKGATKTLKGVKHLILELQKVEYNKGAPLENEAISFVESLGFKLVGKIRDNGPDADYHFKRD
jgi:FkbM family methyltransferase